MTQLMSRRAESNPVTEGQLSPAAPAWVSGGQAREEEVLSRRGPGAAAWQTSGLGQVGRDSTRVPRPGKMGLRTGNLRLI